MTKTLTAAILTVLCFAVSACGSGSGTGTSAAAKHDALASRSISRQLFAAQGKSSSDITAQFSLSKKNTDCVGSGLVDKIGTKSLQRYGVIDKSYHAKKSFTGRKLKPTDAKKATAVFFGCVDVPSKVKSLVAKSIGSLPASVKACFNKALTAATLKPAFEKAFEGDKAGAQSSLQGPLAKGATGSAG